MIDIIRKNLMMGIERIKWLASFLAERTRAETAIAKLFYEKSKVEDKIDDLLRDIGKRVVDLREKGETDVFQDFTIKHALSELKDLKETVNQYKVEADKISKLREE
jgi:enoyl-[acyl-carrier-protein] reductase (NADH)